MDLENRNVIEGINNTGPAGFRLPALARGTVFHLPF
jgi:hypothetical protein